MVLLTRPIAMANALAKTIRFIAAVKWAVENCGSAREILDYLFNLLEEFAGNNNSNGDDTTLVVMKVKSD